MKQTTLPEKAIRSITNSEKYSWGNGNLGWHFFKSDSLSVIREKMRPGTAETLHYHERAQQFFYILSGVATFELSGKTRVVQANEGIHIPPKMLHVVANKGTSELDFLLISEPKAHGYRIDIIEYSPELKEPIKTLNCEWLEKYFKVEPGDEVSLSDPENEILAKGGYIYYARMNNEIVGTVSLLRETDTYFEIGKMAVTEKAQGHYIGHILIELCFIVARQKGIKKLCLYSNKSLSTAIHLYKKFGFKEVELEVGHYERANIKMEREV